MAKPKPSYTHITNISSIIYTSQWAKLISLIPYTMVTKSYKRIYTSQRYTVDNLL